MRHPARTVAALGSLVLALTTLPATVDAAAVSAGTPGATTLEARAQVGAKAAQRVRTAHIRIVTYNARHDVAPGRTIREVRSLAQQSDIITLQEMSSGAKRSGVRRELVSCRGCRWSAHMPRSAVPGGTPILFRKRQYRLERAGTRQVTEPTRVGGRGAGPSVIRAKYINFVRLTERKTGRTVWVLNNHTVPSVQGTGGAPNRRHRVRLGIYRQHMVGLSALVSRFERTGGLIFATGDFNVNYRTDKRAQARMFPYVSMGEVGMRASYRRLGEPRSGTHVLRNGRSDRLIDYVHYAPRPLARPRDHRILKGYASDHRPYLVHFEIASRRR